MKVKIGEIKNLIEGNIYSKDINNEHIIFFKLGNKVYVLEGYCTHEKADLAYGILTENEIICPLHLSSFNIETGQVLNPPAERNLKTYKVEIINGEIFIEL
jgi:nitrite reductase/ring-hydroxylating ferredoxin subunit